MKHIFTLFLLVWSTVIFALTPTNADKNRCYMENDDSSITFLYPMGPDYYSAGTYKALYIRGSMNGWGDDARFLMKLDEESNCYYCTVSRKEAYIPANSGQPEFKFYRDGSWLDAPSWVPSINRFPSTTNILLVLASDDTTRIRANQSIAAVVRPLSDFDLNDPVDQHKISNFRQVPATTCLFRSYHPYHAYRAQYDTEHERLFWVDSLATAAGIKNDICLSSNESGKMNKYTCGGKTYTEAIPPYYQDIIAKNRVLYVGTQNGSTPEYNDVYFNPTGVKFGQWIAEVVDFIIDSVNPGPFEIHCALGTDRTGVFSATLAALCGATWEQIYTDYEYTNNMQIEEFRDRNILAYSFGLMCGVTDMNAVSDMEQAISQYFIRAGYLTQAHIDCLKQKLNGVQPTTLPDKYVIQDPDTGMYKSITVKCYSPGGSPTIWWWGGGDKITSASQTINPKTNSKYTWETRPKMPSVASAWKKVNTPAPEGVDDWYYWTFTNVDSGTGISYIFTSHGNNKSADLTAFDDECRDASYNLVENCPELPSRVIKDWNVSNTTLFGTAPVTYSADTDFDGLTVHAMDKDNRRFEVATCDETCNNKVFTQKGQIGGAAKETFRYLTFDGTEGQELDIWGKGASSSDRVLKLGLGDYSADNMIGSNTILYSQVTHIHFILPTDGTYYIYTDKGNWEFYEAVLSAAAVATQPGEGDGGEQEALTNTAADINVKKVYKNNQILILRGEKTYTITGQEIK